MLLAELASRLPRASIEGAVFVLAVVLVCRLAPRIPARHRALLWWLAAAKLLLALLPIAPVAIAILPAPDASPAEIARRASPSVSGAPAVDAEAPDLRGIASAAWAAGAIALLAGSLAGAMRTRYRVLSGTEPRDPALAAAAESAARAAGLRRAPRILLVPGIEGPLVSGPVRPVILLPSEAPGRLAGAELAMALTHEMTHIARGDLWLGLIPAAARRIFFFHPLAWLAEREYAIAREAACDEAVVARGGADPAAYARLLLRLSAARPAAAAALSPRSMLRRRLEMIESAVRRAPLGRRAAWALLAVATVAFVPLRLVAREAPPAKDAIAAELSAEKAAAEATESCLSLESSTDSAYVIAHGDSRTMCGDFRDMHAIDELRRGGKDLIWFRVDGSSYVVRDPDTVKRALATVRSEQDFARGEAELAKVEARLAELHAKDMARQAQALRERASALPDAKADDLARKIDELNSQVDDLERQMDTLSVKQVDLERLQQARQAEESAREAEAQRALSRILEDAIKNGTAERVHTQM